MCTSWVSFQNAYIGWETWLARAVTWLRMPSLAVATHPALELGVIGELLAVEASGGVGGFHVAGEEGCQGVTPLRATGAGTRC